MFTDFPDLAAEAVDGKAIEANDEFFASKENLLKKGRGIFIPEKFTTRGKWMDGWETRRKRIPGHDWCVIRLGMPGVIKGVDVDTNHFLGNFPPFCSLDARSGNDPWKEILRKRPLKGGSPNLFPVKDGGRFTHVRLHIYPDGGVARLRVHGIVKPDWAALRSLRKPVDLAALVNGAQVIKANDNFFGPKDNLILPGRAKTMGEGWETRRKRNLPGHDWIVIALGRPGRIVKIEIDTNHFKGNFPESCSVEGSDRRGTWHPILPRAKLRAHTRHFFSRGLASAGRVVERLRLNIFPDGGVSRFRAYGTPERWT